ncbi:phospholipase D-like domain-containing protein [soil metagenome]
MQLSPSNDFVTRVASSHLGRPVSSRGRRPWHGFAIVMCCFILQACAALPDITDMKAGLNNSPYPTIETAKGALPKAAAGSLLSKRLAKSADDIKALAALEEAATGVPLIAGNRLTLLFDGPRTLSAMTAAIAAAKDHVNLETYIFDQDEQGMRFADLLIAKQKEGVQVSIIYDSVGTIGTPKEFFERMRNAGIRLTEFNPLNPTQRTGKWRINNRDHRKILIVDGTVAFTGGINISSSYSSSSLFRAHKPTNGNVGWRDTHIKIEGPAVAAFQWIFLNAWTSQQSEELPQRKFFPPLSAVGDKIVRVIASDPDGEHQIFKSYMLAIQEAKKSIHMTSAYFVPDSQLLEGLKSAARRGVDVRIVLPGVPEVGPVFYAGRTFYNELLESGVKIHELKLAVLHAKTAVIDGVWSTVGSTNIDMRSFAHNHEVNLVVLGEAFGAEMESAFKEDLSDSNEMTKEKWEQRPFSDRFKEWTSRMFEYWL